MTDADHDPSGPPGRAGTPTTEPPVPVDARTEEDVLMTLAAAFPEGRYEASDLRDAGGGRGVFSRVVRVALRWSDRAAGDEGPRSVVVKLPALGANGDAGRRSGAYRREALAYRELLPVTPVAAPLAHDVQTDGDAASFVLEDLANDRAVDQLDGLTATDAASVAGELARLHGHWRRSPALARLDVRTSTPTVLDPAALSAGLDTVREHWATTLGDILLQAFGRVLTAREGLVAAFGSAGPPTLCHGDPRADNLVFRAPDRAVLFDWQQLAIQFGAADIAWLAATSLEPDVRREAEPDLLAHAGVTLDEYRLGLVLPGLAVLLLAQRQLDSERTERFVATSLYRIGHALHDHEVHRAAH